MSDDEYVGIRPGRTMLAHNGANFIQWEEDILDLLARKKLASFAKYDKETGLPTKGPPVAPDKDESGFYAAAAELYDDSCAQAMGYIRPTLGINRDCIEGLENPATALYKVREKFEKASRPDKMILLGEYSTLRPQNDDFDTYIKRMDTIIRRLKSCDIVRGEDEILMNWMRALLAYPRDHPFHRVGEYIEMDYVKNGKLERGPVEDMIRRAQARVAEAAVTMKTEEVALAAKQGHFHPAHSDRRICRCCGTMGHIARFCSKREPNGCPCCGKAGHRGVECPHPDAVRWRAGQGGGTMEKANVSTEVDAAMTKPTIYPPELMLSVAAASLISACLVSGKSGHSGPQAATLVDSGCSRHMFSMKRFFDLSPNFQPLRVPVRVGSGHLLYSEGVGDVYVRMNGENVCLPACMYVPGLTLNLISVSQLDKSGCAVLFAAGEARMSRGEKSVLMATRMDSNLYEVDLEIPSLDTACVAATADIWHQRLGHISGSTMRGLQASVDGLPVLHLPNSCSSCTLGKMTRASFTASTSQSTEPLELLSVDLAGPFDESVGGARYFMVVVDAYSKLYHVELLRQKSDAVEAIKRLITRWETQVSRRVKILRSDNGGEFDNRAMADFCAGKGIRQQMTTARTPEQNGIAERAVRTVKEGTRTLLIESGLTDKYWGAAARTFVYTRNRARMATGLDKTSYELFTGVRPDIGRLRVFGCVAYMHIPKEDRTKSVWQPKARRCIFLGYGDDEEKAKKAWVLFDPYTEKKYVTTHVKFCEEQRWADRRDSIPEGNLFFDDVADDVEPEGEHVGEDPGKTDTGEESPQAAEEPHVPGEALSTPDGGRPPQKGSGLWRRNWEYAEEPAAPETSLILPDGVKRNRRPVQRLGTLGENAAFTAKHEPLLDGLLEYCLMSSQEVNADDVLFAGAKQDEMASMTKHGVWTLVPRSECGSRPISTRWVCTMKDQPDGTKRPKARLVAWGHTQRAGRDYDEIFAPVVKLESIRYIIARACQTGMKLAQGDVKTAFLTSLMEGPTVYTEQPKGFVQSGKEDWVCRLDRALYGLHQSPRLFYQHIKRILGEFGFKTTSADSSVFVKFTDKGKVILGLYVDDSLIAADTDELVQETKNFLDTKFEMKWTDNPETLLGLEIHQNRDTGSIALSQKKFALEILEQFDMQDCNPSSTPITEILPAFPKNGPKPEADSRFPFREFIGKMNYLARGTRPDLSFAVSHLATFCSTYQELHWRACERIMKYLKGTLDAQIVYEKDGNSRLLGYSDSDFASNPGDRKSVGAYVFRLADGPISWQSKKQSTVSWSTTEAEYVALGAAAREAVWLAKLDVELKFTDGLQPITIYEDNQPAIALAKNPSTNSTRSKHIDVIYHKVRELIEDNVIRVEYLNTKKMIADLLTKPLAPTQIKTLAKFMNLNLRAPSSKSPTPEQKPEEDEGKC